MILEITALRRVSSEAGILQGPWQGGQSLLLQSEYGCNQLTALCWCFTGSTGLSCTGQSVYVVVYARIVLVQIGSYSLQLTEPLVQVSFSLKQSEGDASVS